MSFERLQPVAEVRLGGYTLALRLVALALRPCGELRQVVALAPEGFRLGAKGIQLDVALACGLLGRRTCLVQLEPERFHSLFLLFERPTTCICRVRELATVGLERRMCL